MSEISASVIKNLREATGAGMMDCKKALAENNGDYEAAKDWLRKKGLAAAAKKSGRVAAEGLVGIHKEGNKAAIIELNSETDFVAKNDKFQALVKEISGYALKSGGDIEKLKEFTGTKSGKKVSDLIADAVAVIGENMTLRRSAVIQVSDGVIADYIHNQQADDMGKIGAIVALESKGDKAKLEALGKQVAMHIAAAKPESLDIGGVNKDALEREKAIYAEQARASGKPENIIDKMVEGRIRKYYEQVVLLEQIFVVDNKTRIADLLKSAEKDVGAPIKLSDYKLFVLGEGVEKQQGDFAAEVAAVVGGN